MNKIWFYLSNVFDNVTKRSLKRTLTIIVDHLSKLLADALDVDIQSLYDRTRPLHDAFADKWSEWKTAINLRVGETQRFEEKMTELSDVKLKEWDVAVQNVFLEGSADYKAIFTHGRTAFRSGTYESRIYEVKTLANTLKKYPNLAELQVKVETYHSDLVRTRDGQQQLEEKIGQASDELESARKDIADMMYANLGTLMNKFYQNPSQVERYFDLSLLRSSYNGNGNTLPPEPMTGTVAPEDIVTVLAGGFDANSYFSIVNTGGTSLKFYSAMLPTDPVSGSALELLPGEEADVYASELGADGNIFIMVNNPDKVSEGTYSFLVIEPVEA